MTEHRTFRGTTCNYLEYKAAFFEAFNIQNPKHTHTWFVLLGKSFSPIDAPTWFYEKRWPHFGIPMDVHHATSATHLKARDVRHSDQPKILKYLWRNRLPWIVKWEYQVHNNEDDGWPCLIRQYDSRWYNPPPPQTDEESQRE